MRVDQLSNEMSNFDGVEFAYDFETYGLKFMEEGFFVRTVSFHNDRFSCSVELSDSEGKYYPGASALLNWIADQKGGIAHNASFEMGVLYAMTGKQVHHKCTYAIVAHLANEKKYDGGWSLKRLGQDLLNWQDWSVDIPKNETMSQLPFEKLGWYNQLDSAATWELYKVCKEAVKDRPFENIFWGYFEEDLDTQLELQFEAYRDGLHIDPEYVAEYTQTVKEEKEECKRMFLEHPDIKPYVDKVNQAVLDDIQAKIDKTPEFTKTGLPTKRRLLYLDKLEQAKTECFFSIDSPVQLRELLYGFLGVEATVFTDTGSPSTDKKALSQIPRYGKMLLEYKDYESQLKFLKALIVNEKNGIVRISIKVPGTLTSRPSSGSIE